MCVFIYIYIYILPTLGPSYAHSIARCTCSINNSVCVCVHACVCMHVCVYISLYVTIFFVCLCVCVWVFVHVCLDSISRIVIRNVLHCNIAYSHCSTYSSAMCLIAIPFHFMHTHPQCASMLYYVCTYGQTQAHYYQTWNTHTYIHIHTHSAILTATGYSVCRSKS